MKKKNRGITAVPLIIAIVLMITVGGFFISLMLGKHVGAPLLAQSTKAFYVADAGIEYTAEYLKSYVDWTTVPDISSTTFGNGTFAVVFINKAQNSITATSTGTSGSAVRVISIQFTRSSPLLAQHALSWLGEVELKDSATITGDPTSPYHALTQEAPVLTPPGGVTWVDLTITGNYNFTPGTYYFNKLEIVKEEGGNAPVVTVSGPVTIWIWDEFEMKKEEEEEIGDGPTFNWGGVAANLLLLAADIETEFELKDSARFKGAIYAPNSGPEEGEEGEIEGTEIELKNNAQIVGAIVGYEVEMKNSSNITFDPTAGVNTSGYSQIAVVITGSGWGEI